MDVATYVGVDLAWGSRNRTGLACVDDAGRLLEVTDRRSDDDITTWLGRRLGGPCLVAIDAPLIVTNPTGRRACEAELSAVFGRYDAGAHPSSTSRPWFAGGTRGARLAARLGLDIAPDSTTARRAIEVYPHPATIVLFDLPRTLKYKHKPGRSLDDLQRASSRLLDLIETLETADPGLFVQASTDWAAICATVAGADRKSQLRSVEDRIDAVLCAYLARYIAAKPECTTTFGDGEHGYIVTPALPDSRMTAAADRAPRIR